MANKKAEIKLADMTRVELEKEAVFLRQEIAKARLSRVGTAERNTRKSYNIRKRLARVLTVLQSKPLEKGGIKG